MHLAGASCKEGSPDFIERCRLGEELLLRASIPSGWEQAQVNQQLELLSVTCEVRMFQVLWRG